MPNKRFDKPPMRKNPTQVAWSTYGTGDVRWLLPSAVRETAMLAAKKKLPRKPKLAPGGQKAAKPEDFYDICLPKEGYHGSECPHDRKD